MDRSNIEKIAKTPEDKVLLAKIWDKLTAGMRKNIPANTAFLTLRALDMCRYLFGNQEGLFSFGGYEGEIIVIFETASKYCTLDSSVDCDGYPISYR